MSFEVLAPLIGQTFTSVVKDYFENNDALVFDGRFALTHRQCCCENVSIEDVAGDLDDLVGAPILRAERRTNSGEQEDRSSTWTFFELATWKGSVTIRFFGSSNGYYSETAELVDLAD